MSKGCILKLYLVDGIFFGLIIVEIMNWIGYVIIVLCVWFFDLFKCLEI